MTLKQLKLAISEKQILTIKEVFDDIQIVDMIPLIEELDVEQTVFLLKCLDKNISGEIFTYLGSDYQEKLVENISGPLLRDILENVYTDDIVDMMDDLPANLAKKVIQAATADTRKEINLLLSFPEDSAGSIMSCDFFELRENDTVKEAIAKLKQSGKLAETINTCYVINNQRRLVGSILLKNFLFENKSLVLKDIMDHNPISVSTTTDQEEVAKLIKKYDITVVPVVNDQNCLIGIVTLDDIIDIMEEEVTEDIHRMNAVMPLEDSYIESSIWKIIVSRLPWLLALMITDTFNGIIISKYELALTALPALTGFIPTVMGTAGNGGGQSSSMVIRSLATNELKNKDIFKVLLKEVFIGLLCSIAIFVACYLRIVLLPSDIVLKSNPGTIAFTVALSMCVSLMIGKIIGGVLPILVNLLHLDPASVAAPIITTIADTTGLIIYFQIAKFVFRL